MKFLKELTKGYLTEEDNSGLPEKSIKDLQSLIRKGAENSGKWNNALELVHKSYEVSSIQRPTPDMKEAWKQYETLISYSVEQLSKYHGQNGTWRMTSESFEEKPKLKVESFDTISHNSFISKDLTIDQIIESIKNDILENNMSIKTSKTDNVTLIEFWEYDVIKSAGYMKIEEL